MPNKMPVRVGGPLWLPTDFAAPANQHQADAALIIHHDDDAFIVAGGADRRIDQYCADPKCPDLKRQDFPTDRPHWHVGKRVVAMVEVKWAETKSNRG